MFKGHPRGLAPLFFTEMWERLGFYLIVGILVLYASDAEKGGLGLTLGEASTIYGTYLAFVYFTPFLGGIAADRWLGYRRAVLIGGLFFALGFYLLGVRGEAQFYGGLVCLCVGNGFFKPNISAMVGNLYQPGDKMRDAGFNLFYMGINIGAAAANLVAAPIRNQISWSWTFWAAAIGILIGVAILLANWKLLEAADKPPGKSPDQFPLSTVFTSILGPAVITGTIGYFLADHFNVTAVKPSMCGFLAGMVPIFVFFTRLPKTVPENERSGLAALLPVYLAGGTFFMILHMNGSALTNWAKSKTDRDVAVVPAAFKEDALPSYYANAPADVLRPAIENFLIVDDVNEKLYGTRQFNESSLASLPLPADVRAVDVWIDGQGVVAGTDDLRRFASFVYRDSELKVKITEKEDPAPPPAAESVADGSTAPAAEVPPTKKRTIEPELAAGAHPLRKVAFTRKVGEKEIPLVLVTEKTVGDLTKTASAETPRLPPGKFLQVVNPEVYQSWNPIFVVLLTPFLVPFWSMLTRRGREVSTAHKLYYGMLLTALAMFVMFVAGWLTDDGKVKVAGLWLVLTYLVLTLGELCLSPMGLSLVTKLSPKRLVGMMMGGWFCASAFGNKLSGFLGELETKMAPSMFFLMLVGAVLLVAGYLRLQLPRLEATLKQYKA
jgi:dipeptide/tripeptide permease